MTRTPLGFYEWRGGASFSSQSSIVANRGSVVFHLSLLLLLQERLIFIRLLALKRLKAPGWRGADRLILYHTSKQTNRPSTTFDGAPWWISPFVTQAGGPKLRWRTISVCVENKNKNIYIYMWIQPNRDRIMNATCWSGGPLERKTARVSRCCCC